MFPIYFGTNLAGSIQLEFIAVGLSLSYTRYFVFATLAPVIGGLFLLTSLLSGRGQCGLEAPGFGRLELERRGSPCLY